MTTGVVVTCEHASARVPAGLADRFRSAVARRALAGHRGSDLGALAVARALARSRRAPLVTAEVTRLVVDANRSEGHRGQFSEFTRDLPAAERERVLARWYRPFRSVALTEMERVVGERGSVLHLSVHSFTPRLGNERRDYAVGLLYDPARPAERILAAAWRDALVAEGLTVRRNRPYRGNADGHTTTLRRRFPDRRYRGIELELNQALLKDGRFPRALVRTVDGTLASALA